MSAEVGFFLPPVERQEFFGATIHSIRDEMDGHEPGVIFDWKRTLYDPDSRELIPGAVELLDFLRQNEVPMALVGKGGEDMHAELDRLNLRGYFEAVRYQEGEKEPYWYLESVLGFHEHMIFVGDKLDSEIQVGNTMGAHTVRVRQGEFAQEEPEIPGQRPDYTVESLEDTRHLIAAMLALRG